MNGPFQPVAVSSGHTFGHAIICRYASTPHSANAIPLRPPYFAVMAPPAPATLTYDAQVPLKELTAASRLLQTLFDLRPFQLRLCQDVFDTRDPGEAISTGIAVFTSFSRRNIGITFALPWTSKEAHIRTVVCR